ncbi:hypothetical protein [Acidovorax sp.]|uniref:hypothetical protein n=1 Tax=Acidovorax sp. TaxID=1872122 RepID=UPI00391FBA3D
MGQRRRRRKAHNQQKPHPDHSRTKKGHKKRPANATGPARSARQGTCHSVMKNNFCNHLHAAKSSVRKPAQPLHAGEARL